MPDDLVNLGLTPFFTRQLSPEEVERRDIARIMEIQRTRVFVNDGSADHAVTIGGKWFRLPAQQRPTIGDWVVLDTKREKIERLLERKSVFKRVAAGTRANIQLIAANVDILFIVTSCNDEFKESRLERYLALAQEAGVEPVVVLTKVDISDDAQAYRERVLALNPDIAVELVNGLDARTLDGVASWVSAGTTIALVGSSGVGKSTIVNTLSGDSRTQTAAIREQDAKGRHTTSYRALYRLASGGLLLDVPGIRELKLPQLESSVGQMFDDVESIASGCRFSDCAHEREPGCAVREAIVDGTLTERRVENYLKLLHEESRHRLSAAELRQADRQFSKTVRQHVDLKRQPANKGHRRR